VHVFNTKIKVPVCAKRYHKRKKNTHILNNDLEIVFTFDDFELLRARILILFCLTH